MTYVTVSSPEEYEKLTGTTLGEAARRAFGQCTKDHKSYLLTYSQAKLPNGEEYVTATSETEAKARLVNYVSYARDAEYPLSNIKVISVIPAFDSMYVSDVFKGRVPKSKIKG